MKTIKFLKKKYIQLIYETLKEKCKCDLRQNDSPEKKQASIYKENESKRKGVQHMGNEKVLGYSIKCAKDTKKKNLTLMKRFARRSISYKSKGTHIF